MLTHLHDLTPYLQPLGLNAWRYYSVVDSTNDLALAWVREGALDWSLVLADAQTAGRGRSGRPWVTEPGGSLAFSLILRPSSAMRAYFTRFTALAALGLSRALSGWGLQATIKWPNDILLMGKKVAGVLVEADWQSDQVEAVVIGLGVNVSSESIPPTAALRYPATAVETVLGDSIDRWALLSATLWAMRNYQEILTEDAFIETWNAQLAFRGDWVWFRSNHQEPHRMRIVGINPEGGLSIEYHNGDRVDVTHGEILMSPKGF